MKSHKSIKLFLSTCIVLVFLVGCQNKKTLKREVFLMDSIMTLTISAKDEKELDNIEQILTNIEQHLSKTIPTSDIFAINTVDSDVKVDTKTASLIQKSLTVCQNTNGAYHPALGSLMDAWGFSADTQNIPDAKTIEKLRNDSKINTVNVSKNIVNSSTAKIDLGGAVKGYALDEIRNYLQNTDITSGLFALSGSIYAHGKNSDGNPWSIGIRDPYGNSSSYLATIELENTCISTSGVYERGFTEDDVYYHHILDPQTGYPVDNEIMSVSIIDKSGFHSDVYATALLVMGLEEGLAYANQNNIDAIFVTKDKQIYLTDSFDYPFKVTNDDYEKQ